jgi:hypothetical protein
MKSAALSLVASVIVAAAAASAYAQSEEELKRYEALDRQCEAARAEKLAPIRREKIDQCVSEGRARADCEAEFQNYGNTRAIVGGAPTGQAKSATKPRAIGGQFYDLPECVAAHEARRSYRQ